MLKKASSQNDKSTGEPVDNQFLILVNTKETAVKYMSAVS